MGPRVAIAGGGLGGLSAALFLLRAGVLNVRVFEQQSELAEIGAGIQIAPNALRLLQRLGVGDALMSVAVPFEVAWEFRRWEDGEILFSQTYGAEGEARFGAPYVAIHRAHLLDVLGDELPAGIVELGRRVEAVSDEGDAVSVAFADGSTESFDVLIGADGIHSVVRAALLGDESPVFTGLAAYRALVPAARGAGVRAPGGLLDLARPAAALRPLPGLSRPRDQPGDGEPGRRLARGVLDRRGHRRRLRGGVLRLGRARPAADRGGDPDQALRVLRARAGRALGPGPRRDPRRRRPSDAPVLRPGRGPGDRGRRGAGGLPARRVRRQRAGRPAPLRVAAPRTRDPRPAPLPRTPRAPPHARR